MQNSKYNVRDSVQFRDKVKDLTITNDEKLVSFDVVSKNSGRLCNTYNRGKMAGNREIYGYDEDLIPKDSKVLHYGKSIF